MNTQSFHKIKYDLKGHGRSRKTLLAKFFLAHNFILMEIPLITNIMKT